MNTHDLVHGESIAQRGYATFLRRFKALLFDALIIILTMVAVTILITIIESAVLTKVAIILTGAGAFLYDPVLVSIRGGTIGHYRFNMRVLDVRTGGRIGLLRALLRNGLKLFLGALSFFFMLLTRRHQALHDLVSGSAVVVHDLTGIPAGEVLYERSARTDVSVPPWRRVAAILVYSVIAFLSLGFLSGLFLTEECVFNDVCAPRDDLIATLSAVAMILTFGMLMVLGWSGRLPGAANKKSRDHT